MNETLHNLGPAFLMLGIFFLHEIFLHTYRALKGEKESMKLLITSTLIFLV